MKYYMAFDIGGSNVKYAVVNGEGKIFEKGKFKTPHYDIEELIGKIGEVTKGFSLNYNFEGVAMSAPGAVNNETGLIGGCSAVPCIHGPNIRVLIEKKTGLRVALENDANCAALAEVWKGIAKDVKDVLFVVIGTGIGGAVIKDRKLHTGQHLFGGEFGFMIMEHDYDAGIFRGWSETASTYSIVKKAAKIKGISPEEFNGEVVFKMAEEGDEDCRRAINECLNSLAIGIYNLQHIYDPEMIVIGGAISSREDIIDEINKRLLYMKDRIRAASVLPRLERCAFLNDANIIGAVFNFMSTFRE